MTVQEGDTCTYHPLQKIFKNAYFDLKHKKMQKEIFGPLGDIIAYHAPGTVPNFSVSDHMGGAQKRPAGLKCALKTFFLFKMHTDRGPTNMADL